MTESILSERALGRRLKRHFMKEMHTFFAPCAPGFEEVLQHELKSLPDVQITMATEGGVEFSGPIAVMYSANIRLRTANRVLLRFASFTCKAYPSLFNKVRTKPWELVLGRNPVISFSVTAKGSRLNNEKQVARTLTEAIQEHYRQFGLTIAVTDSAPITVYVRLNQDLCTLSIDTSGEHLHKRGYKLHTVEAPLRETIAAGLLLSAPIYRYPVIIDPFCGSGTFVLEAASILADYYPSVKRDFAFRHLPFFNEAAWNRILLSISTEHTLSEVELIGIDIDQKAVHAAESNRNRLGLTSADISFISGNALSLSNSWGTSGLIVTNLPYGKRVGPAPRQLGQLYENFGNRLREKFSGWDVLLVSDRTGLLKKLPLRITRSMSFDNGGIRVTAIQGTVI